MKHHLYLIWSLCLLPQSAYEKTLALPTPHTTLKPDQLFGHLGTSSIADIPLLQKIVHKNDSVSAARVALKQKLSLKKKKLTYTLALRY